MGVFGTVEGKFFCPFCGSKLQDFQTKDLNHLLNVYSFVKKTQVGYPSVEIHTDCKKCKNWISLNVARQNLQLAKGEVSYEV
ncbi:MAG: hypothetical protein V1722_01460 [Candidatus Micrarchaeota archaeon]